ncbi:MULTISPECIES: hypothetical protein [Faecalibacterium]|uniref:hypothetical protein n=1 Tax=Faecalibacterium TaxID=216851 RepID=UPI000E508F80|nr:MULTISPECIES: hypothetical protein [Faecalibacterium]RHQ27687.1 hypothetical protein DWY95_09050 [Faecalibacterium sp. AF28-13AC]
MIGLLNAGPHVYTFTIEQLWTSILGVCGGITAIAAAVAVILSAIKKAKEPDTKQNAKLDDHDKHLEDVDRKLKNDQEVLDLYRSKILSLEEHQKEQDIIVEEHSRKIAGVEQRVNRSEHGINVMMKALLALLSHGIDGNAIDPMKEAKAALESYLIDGQSSKNT